MLMTNWNVRSAKGLVSTKGEHEPKPVTSTSPTRSRSFLKRIVNLSMVASRACPP